MYRLSKSSKSAKSLKNNSNKTLATAITNDASTKTACNIMRALELLNTKEYFAEFGPGTPGRGGKPYILFREEISSNTFDQLPAGFTGQTIYDRTFEMYFDVPDRTDSEKYIQALYKVSKLLLDWAENLPHAVRLSFEINVPSGVSPRAFMALIVGNFRTPNIDVYDEDEEDSFLEGSILTTPKMFNLLSKGMLKCAKVNKVHINITDPESGF